MVEVKVRPVIVASRPQGRYGIIAVVPVSSRTDREAVDVLIEGWSKGGLVRPSVAWVHRLTTMLQSDLVAYLGDLSDQDVTALEGSLRRLLALGPLDGQNS